jgi:lysozyme
MFDLIIDVSTWQRDIDKKKMLAAGAKAMYIKAGGTDKNNGASYTDFRFRENAEKFSNVVPCGYYYFFYPHFDGKKQAEYFVNLLKSVKWNLPPAIDVESNPSKVSQRKFQGEIKEFLVTIEKELNIKGVIYTRATFWNPNVGSPSWAKDYKLWIARYGETLEHPWNNDSKSFLRPKPWDDYWLWQYSADKNNRGKEFGVATSGIDINKANMTEKEFYDFAKWEVEEIPEGVKETERKTTVTPPTPEIKPKYPHEGFLRRGFSVLRLRSTPTTSQQNVVGSIGRGYNFTVHKQLTVGDDLWWLVELPDHTVGWSARRYNGVTYLEFAD